MSEERRISPDEWVDEIANTDGFHLIVAGPGTGKTEFLVRRVAHLIESGKAKRDEVLVLTFSRRAASAMARRIESMSGASTVPIESTTFHSLALRILEAAHQGDPPTPLTTPEQIGLVKELLASDEPGNWPLTYRSVLASTGFAEEVADFLMRCSERLLGPSDIASIAVDRADWKGIAAFYSRYLDEQSARRRIDYGTLLSSCLDVLSSHPDLIDQYRYVLVDEYQDTSPAQAAMAEALSAQEGNLTVAGDPYQSIYSFRGAELRNIEQFESSMPDVNRVVLDQSFRVPEEIMAAALRVVSGGSLPGAAGPVKPAPHRGIVETYIFNQETAEAEWIARQTERAIHVERIEPARIAIIVRSKQEMLNELSRALDRRKVPHNRPDQRLVDHPAVKLVADLVTLSTETASNQSEDVDQAARRLFLGPLIRMSLGEQRRLWGLRQTRGTWSQAIAGQEELTGIASLLDHSDWATELPAIEGFWAVWTELDQFETIVHDTGRDDWRMALSSFSQVLDQQANRDPDLSLADYFRLSDSELIEATPLLSHRRRNEGVTLTTLHQAKGLEFDVVFIANAVEGVFPDLRRGRRMLRPELLSPDRTTDASALSQFQVQEEMRLGYTAMTRARLRAVWTATDAGVDQGEERPSRFLVAASHAESVDEIGPPPDEPTEPVTVAEAEIALRRTASDPAAVARERLAAVDVLARSPVGAWEARRFAGVPPRGPNRPILPEKFSMSPSQADGYSQCPRKYAIERRLRISDPASVHMRSGSLIHRALEVAETSAIGTGEPHADLGTALRSLDEVWEDGDFGTPAQNRAWRKRAEALVARLYEIWPKDAGRPIELEKQVSLEIEGVTWYGVIDRLEEVDTGVRVIDYKTGRTVPTHRDAEVSIQLGFYALAVNADPELPNVVSAELWFPANDSKSLTVRSLDMTRLADVEAAMREVTAQVAQENWEPRVSARCGRCDFKSSCPAWPEGKGAFL